MKIFNTGQQQIYAGVVYCIIIKADCLAAAFLQAHKHIPGYLWFYLSKEINQLVRVKEK